MTHVDQATKGKVDTDGHLPDNNVMQNRMKSDPAILAMITKSAQLKEEQALYWKDYMESYRLS